MTAIEEAIEHAKEHPLEEVCGLIVANGDVQRLIRGENVDPNPAHQFELGVEAWLQRQPGEKVVMVYHSHPRTGPTPSMVDLVQCEKHGLPWLIVTPSGDHHIFKPSGFEAPYEGRPYSWLTFDCFTLLQDFYRREFKLRVEDMPRREFFEDRREDLITPYFESRGFRELIDVEPRRGDVFVFQLRSHVPNHLGIYMGDGMFLHHVRGRLSVIEPYGGMWAKAIYAHLRHKNHD